MVKHSTVGRNDIGCFSETTRWTTLAQECYERGCNCSGCLYSEFNGNRSCKVKACVLELVRVFGRPPEARIKSEGRSCHVIQYT